MLSTKEKILDLILFLILVGGLLFIISIFIKRLNVKNISKDGVLFGNNEGEELKFSETTQNDNDYNTNKRSVLAHRIFKFLQSTKMEGYLFDVDNSLQSFFRCYFDVMYDELLDFFRQLELNDGDELYKISERYINIINRISERCKVNNIRTSNFFIKNTNHNKMIIDNISDIIQDESYMDWYSKSLSILDVVYIGCKLALSDIKGE